MSRNTVRLRRLMAMDTDATENASEVERIKREASLLGLYEAFLESGPQFVVQLVMIIRRSTTKSHLINTVLQLCCT